MWKFLSRGVRETFERSVSLGRTDVRVKKETQNKPCCWRFTCAAVKPVNSEPKEQECQTNSDDGPKERKRYKTAAHNHCLDAWLGAFSYSSALVLGWVITQPYYRWRKWWEVREQKPKFILIQPGSLVQLLTKVAVSQPKKSLLDSSQIQLCNDSVVQNVPYGPLTADQAIEEAAEELKTVHDSMIGEVENRRGVDLISLNKGKEAVEFFKSATHRGYPPAAYNLAQCYEMGIGTNQDFKQAAKWYERAAELGHATAMYNLGVFYAHGWGGLEPSNTRAKQLFREAARRGQPDATAALNMKHPPNVNKESDWGFSDNHQAINVNNDLSNDPNKLFDLAVAYENSIEDESTDPYLILQMYELASTYGHTEAKSRLSILKAYDAVGLLSDFLLKKKSSQLVPEVMFDSRSSP